MHVITRHSHTCLYSEQRPTTTGACCLAAFEMKGPNMFPSWSSWRIIRSIEDRLCMFEEHRTSIKALSRSRDPHIWIQVLL